MKTIKHQLAVVAFACSLCGFATDYYVDAVNGNDANSGLEGSPKESFAALFKAYSIKSGDKVHAAAGIYTNGVMLSGSTKFRLVVPAGVEIIGAGADVTTIEGQAHTNELGETTLDAEPWGCGANAIRGVYLNSNAILRNFTVTKGYAPNYSNQTGGGVLAAGKTSIIVGCVITNCAAYRGAMASGTAVRCRFANNRGGTGCDIFSGAAFNCLFGDCPTSSNYNVYQGSPYVNCTFYGVGKSMYVQKDATNVIHNSLLLKDVSPQSNAAVILTNCVAYASKATFGGGSISISGVAAAKVDANYRPLRNSPCLDAGDLEIYTSKFPAALADEMWTDYLGNARKVGTNIDVGACESLFATGAPFDWYVDAENGSDANDGTSSAAAFQNLSMALTNSYLRAGDTVHAAPGLYTNGVITSKWRFRAVVPADVALVGDTGAERTFIVGEPDPAVELNASPWGCGSEATLCVRLWEGASVRGFTLTGGRAAGYDGNNFGAAVYCGDNNINNKTYGYVIDCIITNNCAARGAGVFGAVSLRCRFADNRASQESSDIRGGCAFNCLFGDVLNASTHNFYGSSDSQYCANCTFYGSGAAGRMNSKKAGLRNCVILKDVGLYQILSNCVYTGTLGSGSEAGNSKKVDSVEAVHLDVSYRPLRNSPALDKADASFYALPDVVADEAGYDFLKAARVQGLGIDIGALESSETSVGTNWYVNVVTGSDENDGTTSVTAFKTLAGAMANDRAISNDVVHVAAGVYSTGTMEADSKSYRVVVPEGVTLLGAGANETVIEGAPADGVPLDGASHGCGEGAVSCVRLYAGSMVRGFTLTKGCSPAWNGTGNINWGGAVVASGVNNAAYVVDCVLTNNFAGRGAGLYQGTAIRCRFNENGVATTGTDIMQGRAYNCIFGNVVNTGGSSLCNVYQIGPYVNCTFYGRGNVSHEASVDVTNIWNGAVLKTPGQHVKLIGCATIAAASYCGEGSFTLTQDAMMLDENYAPMAGSPLLDRGRNDLYATFPADVAEALAKTDFAGSQRVYNGSIDIGAYEYDWRGDYSSRLGRSCFTVAYADPGVITNGMDAVLVPAGCSVTNNWDLRENGTYTFSVAATGEGVSVLRDGVVMSGADGIYTFQHSGDRTTTQIAISCDGSSSAIIRGFNRIVGFSITFR